MIKTIHTEASSGISQITTYQTQPSTSVYGKLRQRATPYNPDGSERCGNDHECWHHKLPPGKFGNYSGRTGRDQEST